MSIQVPLSHSAKVTAMCFFWLKIEIGENVLDMVPVLHNERICMIDNHHLNGRQEVILVFLPSILNTVSYCQSHRAEMDTHPSFSMAVRKPRGLARIISEL